ncbi:MAG: hypothetical protein HQ591_06290 [candidate division Zixibacteria bacterium]|nr:hypothetical protein [Candidatus Tariuqbacter arcticus]
MFHITKIRIIFIISILITVFIGCATVPKVTVRRPWYRVFNFDELVEQGAKLSIEVTGTTEPLLGDEELLRNDFRAIANDLLSRRGYVIDTCETEYRVKISYKTYREDIFGLTSYYYSQTYGKYYSSMTVGSADYFGYGVNIASAVSRMTTKSQNIAMNIIDEKTSYNHIISLEILNESDNIIWKGESTWDSPNIEIRNEVQTSMQLLISNLPSDPNYRVSIPEVKESHKYIYYRLYCYDNWFSCPALPYRVGFYNPAPEAKTPNYVENPEALEAYIDLIKTAEYALPIGYNDWRDDPLKKSLWSKVLLGGKYLLGARKKPINIMVRLEGYPKGYEIKGCWIASDKEFSEFQVKMKKWRKKLQDYFSVYVQD